MTFYDVLCPWNKEFVANCRDTFFPVPFPPSPFGFRRVFWSGGERQGRAGANWGKRVLHSALSDCVLTFFNFQSMIMIIHRILLSLNSKLYDRKVDNLHQSRMHS